MNARKQAFFPDHPATGPYSPALAVGEWVFVAGQGPLDPKGKIVGDTLEAQAELTLQNVQRALEAAGATLADCVKVTVFLRDLDDYDRFNAVYRRFFSAPYPARTLVGSALWHDIRVEIDAVAIRGCGSAGT